MGSSRRFLPGAGLSAAAGWLLVLLAGRASAGIMSVARVMPSHVTMLSEADEAETISLSVSLQLQNLTQLEGLLKAVSTPGSQDYGKYLDADEVSKLFPPSPESRSAVINWLESENITDISDQGTHINFATDVGTANRLLSTTFSHFDVEGADKLRTMRYSIPDELETHIALVSPTTYFGRTVPYGPISVRSTAASGKEERRVGGAIVGRQTGGNQTVNCERVISPVCMERLYGYGGYAANFTASGSRVGFGSFLNQSARLADLVLYQDAFGLPRQNFTTVLINGGLDHQDPRGGVGEANLDLQFMTAVVKTLPVTQFITGGSPPYIPSINLPAGRNTNEPYLEYYQHLMTMKNAEIPQVISNSYGEDEQVRSLPRRVAWPSCRGQDESTDQRDRPSLRSTQNGSAR